MARPKIYTKEKLDEIVNNACLLIEKEKITIEDALKRLNFHHSYLYKLIDDKQKAKLRLYKTANATYSKRGSLYY